MVSLFSLFFFFFSGCGVPGEKSSRSDEQSFYHISEDGSSIRLIWSYTTQGAFLKETAQEQGVEVSGIEDGENYTCFYSFSGITADTQNPESCLYQASFVDTEEGLAFPTVNACFHDSSAYTQSFMNLKPVQEVVEKKAQEEKEKREEKEKKKKGGGFWGFVKKAVDVASGFVPFLKPFSTAVNAFDTIKKSSASSNEVTGYLDEGGEQQAANGSVLERGSEVIQAEVDDPNQLAKVTQELFQVLDQAISEAQGSGATQVPCPSQAEIADFVEAKHHAESLGIEYTANGSVPDHLPSGSMAEGVGGLVCAGKDIVKGFLPDGNPVKDFLTDPPEVVKNFATGGLAGFAKGLASKFLGLSYTEQINQNAPKLARLQKSIPAVFPPSDSEDPALTTYRAEKDEGGSSPNLSFDLEGGLNLDKLLNKSVDLPVFNNETVIISPEGGIDLSTSGYSLTDAVDMVSNSPYASDLLDKMPVDPRQFIGASSEEMVGYAMDTVGKINPAAAELVNGYGEYASRLIGGEDPPTVFKELAGKVVDEHVLPNLPDVKLPPAVQSVFSDCQ